MRAVLQAACDHRTTANSLLTKLSDVSTPPSASKPAWSVRLADRFRCTLPQDVAAWFDEEVWRGRGSGEYGWPTDPQVLLERTPEVIWPALMPPDLLPVLGNGMGDWLCLRLDERDRVSSVVQWYHGGGDWIPWGQTLAEAILFDAVTERLPGPHRRHAPSPEPTASRAAGSPDRFLRWAVDHLPPEAEIACRDVSGQELAEVLLGAGIAEEAVRCELVQAALVEPLSSVLDPVATQGVYAEWNQVVEWMFDLRRMPAGTRRAWGDLFEVDLECEQDWGAVREHCRRVIECSPELAWAWDLYGYCCHRQGELTAALQAYHSGAMKSVFSDQSIRLRTHWAGGRAAKFSAAMLRDLSPESIESSEYLSSLCSSDARTRREAVARYWTAQAKRCREAGDFGGAHAAVVSAGWDLGLGSLGEYAGLLESVERMAAAAGYVARAELAATHRACLRSRYRL